MDPGIPVIRAGSTSHLQKSNCPLEGQLFRECYSFELLYSLMLLPFSFYLLLSFQFLLLIYLPSAAAIADASIKSNFSQRISWIPNINSLLGGNTKDLSLGQVAVHVHLPTYFGLGDSANRVTKPPLNTLSL
jgi:hypothetical protein